MADPHRHALVIATSRYSDPRLRRLAAPLNDAKAFAAVLRDPKVGDFTVTTVLDKESAPVAEAIEAFCGERGVDDTIVVYFSGHGVTDDAGNLYLAARNTVRERLRSTGVSDGFLRDVLRTCRAQRQVLVLDCCFGGAFTKGMLAKGADDTVNIEATFGGVGAGRVILTASNARQFAMEDDDTGGDAPRRSVFTRTIVDGLRSGEADLDGDQQISVDDLYKFAYRRIAIPGSSQTPTITNIGLEGTIVLARAEARPVSVGPVTGPTTGPTMGAAPRARDLRPFTRVLDAGTEGAAAALAAVTAMETYLAYRGSRTALSARYLYQKVKQLAGDPEGRDTGIDLTKLTTVLEDVGTVPESAWPYVPNHTARPKGRTLAALDKLAAPYRARLLPVRSVDEIGPLLDLGMPVLASFRVYESTWYTDAVTAGAVIQAPKPGEQLMGSTLVVIVDLDRDAGVLRFANSWGPTWGEHGFGAMTIEAAEATMVVEQMWAVSLRTPPATGSFKWTFGDAARPSAPTAPSAPPASVEHVARTRSPGRRAAPASSLQRFVYDGRVLGASYAQLSAEALRRSEGDKPTRDEAVDRVYDAMGTFDAFLADAFQRRSWDGEGAPYRAVVHYGERYVNGFWDGGARVAVLGDGDGTIFNGFYGADVVAKQFANALVSTSSSMVYAGQSGSVINAVALVLAAMAAQHDAHQDAEDADWLIGTDLFPAKVKARALFALLDPGTAFDDPSLGRDPSVGHMDHYVTTQDDSGGVHVNSGIATRAFALSARALGGPSWERAGAVWYRTLTGGTLKPKTTFATFAAATLAVARRDFGAEVVRAVEDGWRQVGVLPGGPATAASGPVRRARSASGSHQASTRRASSRSRPS
jgi:hypothetical protein